MFPSGEMPENRESHTLSASSRLFVLPAFSSPHLPYYRVGALLWTFPLKTRRLFPYSSPPCRHYSSNPAGARGKKHRLLTFHITESDQLCNHLPSKNGMLFAGQRPPFSPLLTQNPIGLGLKRCLSPSISPTWTTFAAIYPQKSGCFSGGALPNRY